MEGGKRIVTNRSLTQLKKNNRYQKVKMEVITNDETEKEKIDGQYAGIKIAIVSDAVFDFELDLQYDSFKGEDDKMKFYKKISQTTKKYYEGKFGFRNSNASIFIKYQYGGISIK